MQVHGPCNLPGEGRSLHPLSRRPPTRRFDIHQFGLPTSADLLSHFPKGWVAHHSLGMAELREANALAKALHATYDEQLEACVEGLRPRVG